jgi:hypothetical protein
MRQARRLLLATILGIWLCLAFIQPAGACSCYGLPMSHAVYHSAAIFEGRLVHLTEPSWVQDGHIARPAVPYRTAQFAVERVWKGPAVTTQQVAVGSSLCSYPFRTGGRYLVWASAAPPALGSLPDGVLADPGICSPTIELDGRMSAELDDLAQHHRTLRANVMGMGLAAGALVTLVAVLQVRVVRRARASLARYHQQGQVVGGAPAGFPVRVLRRVGSAVGMMLVILLVCAGVAFVLVGLEECDMGPPGQGYAGLLVPRC